MNMKIMMTCYVLVGESKRKYVSNIGIVHHFQMSTNGKRILAMIWHILNMTVKVTIRLNSLYIIYHI